MLRDLRLRSYRSEESPNQYRSNADGFVLDAAHESMVNTRSFLHGAVAQLGERLNGIQEVDGSIPFGSTNLINRLASRARVRSSSEEFTKEFKALPFATLDLALEV